MYLPEQMIPFLTHEDPAVRGYALRYLAEAHDPSPATADDIWRSIDRFGYREPGIAWAQRLPDFPSTDASTARLLDALGHEESDFDIRYDLLMALQQLELPLLVKNWERIGTIQKIPDHVMVELRARVALFEAEPEDLWHRLHDVADTADDELDDPDALHGSASSLIDALTLHPEFTSPKVLEALREHGEPEVRFEYYVELAGRLRLDAAVDELLWRLRDEQGDWINEEAIRALCKIGTIEVIDKLVAAYPMEDKYLRVSVTEVFGRIKRPESERAIVRLLESETDEELRSFFLGSLCSLCPTEPAALEMLRQVILKEQYDPSIVDLRGDLSDIAVVTGYAPPELEAWREHARRARARIQESVEQLMGRSERDHRKRWVLEGPSPEVEDEPEESDEPFDPEWYNSPAVVDRDPFEPAEPGYAPTGPIRRESPKIGRNDPCPCGSGKKYKKCCGANA
ncbi:MAG TPA: HEAT repeat domain-containing protein [Tepidisphaeraceae bacterium]|nr:HEAT repeat domain-containing protein [Tepidisphaeraceae bacterium]